MIPQQQFGSSALGQWMSSEQSCTEQGLDSNPPKPAFSQGFDGPKRSRSNTVCYSRSVTLVTGMSAEE